MVMCDLPRVCVGSDRRGIWWRGPDGGVGARERDDGDRGRPMQGSAVGARAVVLGGKCGGVGVRVRRCEGRRWRVRGMGGVGGGSGGSGTGDVWEDVAMPMLGDEEEEGEGLDGVAVGSSASGGGDEGGGDLASAFEASGARFVNVSPGGARDEWVAGSFSNDAAAWAAATGASGPRAFAVIDRSHGGRVVCHGPGRLGYLSGRSTGMMAGLEPGRGAMTSVGVTAVGAAVDVALVLHNRESTLVLTGGGGAGTRDKVVEGLRDGIFPLDATEVEDFGGERTRCFCILGPGAADGLVAMVGGRQALDSDPGLAAVLGGAEGDGLGPVVGRHTTLGMRGRPVVLARGCPVYGDGLVVLGEAGADAPGMAFTLVVDEGLAADVWRALVRAGATPCGEETAEAVRVASGRPGWRELQAARNVGEASLWSVVAPMADKGCYAGAEALSKVARFGPTKRQVVGLVARGDVGCEPGDAVFSVGGQGKPLGVVTSAARVPTGEWRALALLSVATLGQGSEVAVGEDRLVKATVAMDLPGLARTPQGYDDDEQGQAEDEGQARKESDSAKRARQQAAQEAYAGFMMARVQEAMEAMGDDDDPLEVRMAAMAEAKDAWDISPENPSNQE